MKRDAYTLQIVFPDPMADLIEPSQRRYSGEQNASRPTISSREQIAETQVWLLAPAGSVINPTSTSGKAGRVVGRRLKIASLRYIGETPVEVQYSFPLSASENAVAVAVMLDGKLYIDRLQPLN